MNKMKAARWQLTLEDIGCFLDKLAENSENVYWLSSPDFKKIQYISPAYEKIWGRSREILYINPELWITYLHPEDARSYHPIHAMAERISRLGEHARYEEDYRIVCPNGEIRWIIDRGFPIYDHLGVCRAVTGVAVDITNEKQVQEELRKAKEKAEAANKAKTEFLENMRHDIRTPLTGIIGFAQLIKNDSTEKKIIQYADSLVASSHTLLDFLNEVLEVIRIDSGDIPLSKHKFNLADKITSIIHLTQPQAKAKKLILSFKHDKKIPSYLIGDAKRVHRILLELVTNALNFTLKGHVTITSKLIRKRRRDVIIKIAVEDSGIGISSDQHEDIFCRFKKLTPSYTGMHKGIGLGLSIVKQFIEDLGGEIYLMSQVGKGSQFVCILPFKEALSDDNTGVEKLPSHAIAVPRSKMRSLKFDHDKLSLKNPSRILLVEDEIIAATVTKSMLTELNCQVEIAADGKTAIDLAVTQSFDLIFMDIGLPDSSGYEIVKRIRAWETPLNKRTPIFALTAHAESNDKQSYIEMGLDAVLIKPLLRETAMDILAAFIPKRDLSPSQSIDSTLAKEKHLNELKGHIIDLTLGAKLVNGDENFAKEMILKLSASLKKEIPLLKKAHTKNEWDTIQAIAHKLRGGASYCGTPRLKEACMELENCLKSKKTKLREKLFQQLLSEMSLVTQESAKL